MIFVKKCIFQIELTDDLVNYETSYYSQFILDLSIFSKQRIARNEPQTIPRRKHPDNTYEKLDFSQMRRECLIDLNNNTMHTATSR